MSLIDFLIEEKWLKTASIIKAFKEVDRKNFMPESIKQLSEINEAMPIGQGQTISQPLTVAFMLEELQPEKGDNILDVGSGSGWTTALLSFIAGDKGRVTAVEIVPELKEFGEKNAQKFVKKGIAKFILGDGSLGCKENAPYDKILVSASADNVPSALKKQLKVGGRMVIPVKESIFTIVKKTEKEFEEKEHKGFVFVPLV